MNKNTRILKVATCPSLSNRSTLTYHIGCKDKEIYIRLFLNSERGLFSREWISLEQIELSEGAPITSRFLNVFFKGKSANTAAFLMAVLISEGLIKPIEEKSRTYRRCDPTAFKAAIQALIDSEVTLDAAQRPPKKKGRKSS